MHRLQELVRLHRQGSSARDVARLLRMSRNTVRSYLNALAEVGLLHGPAEELPALEALKGATGAWAVLIGPEGGFDEKERARLRSEKFVTVAGLGPRILRADTAAIAALSLWQASAGDWR